MLLLDLLIVPMLALAPAPAATLAPIRPDSARVTVDTSARRVVVTVGPLRVPPSMEMDEHDPMMMAMMRDSCVGMFSWPRSSYFHELHLEILDAHGAPLPRQLIHHLTLYNLDRRQLIYPIVERIVGFGQETENIAVPATVGMPMEGGQRIAVVVMWNNTTGHDVEGAQVRLTFHLNPRNQSPAPIAAMPMLMDANLVAGGLNAFEVPPGGVTRSFEFTIPISGRLLAVGGHLHDHGEWVRLEDAQTGKELATVRPINDHAGHVTGMTRSLLALWGAGPRLVAGRRYRVLVRYSNPTADALVGMMGLMAGLFAPDDMRAWPRIDHTNPDYLADLMDIHGATLDSVPASVVRGREVGTSPR